MAIDTDQGKESAAPATMQISVGHCRSVITDAATYVLKTGKGRYGHLVVSSVGTTWVISLYDEVAASGSKVFEWVSADGKGTFPLQIPCHTGMTLVSSGTAGLATLVWSDKG